MIPTRVLITDDDNCIDGRTGTGELDSERVPAFRVDPGDFLALVKTRGSSGRKESRSTGPRANPSD